MAIIQNKICAICKETKEIIEFRRDKTRKDGFHPYCKTCQLQYRRKDPTNLIRLEGERRRHIIYSQGQGKITRLDYSRREDRKLKSKEYAQSEAGRCSQKKGYLKLVNEGKLKDYHHNKYYNDIAFKIRHNLSGRVRSAIKRNNHHKNNSVFELLGCSIDFLKQHLESQFQEGMTWENYGMHGWHIDHIIPCSYFDLKIKENQFICFHYLNLQPLWRNENCYIKADNVPENIEVILNSIKSKLYHV